MIKIENKLKENLKIGILEFHNIKILKPEPLQNFIKDELRSIKSKDEPPEGFTYTRKLYKSFKIDPTKHRPSSEALWRRFKRKGDFPQVNPFVDLLNLLSLKHQISCGLYDIDKITGKIVITLGEEEDQYKGIRKNNINLKGKIVLKDDLGAFGNPSADSLRTSVNENSKNILIILFFLSNAPQDFIDGTIKSFKEKYNHFFEKEKYIESIL